MLSSCYQRASDLLLGCQSIFSPEFPSLIFALTKFQGNARASEPPWLRHGRERESLFLPNLMEGREMFRNRMRSCSSHKCASRINPTPSSFCSWGQRVHQKILGITGAENRSLSGNKMLLIPVFLCPQEKKRGPCENPSWGFPTS